MVYEQVMLRHWLVIHYVLAGLFLLRGSSADTWLRGVQRAWDIPGKCDARTELRCSEPLAGYHACELRPPESITVSFYSYDPWSRTVRDAVSVVLPSAQAPMGYEDLSSGTMKANILSLMQPHDRHIGKVWTAPITPRMYLDFLQEAAGAGNVVRFDKPNAERAWFTDALQGMEAGQSTLLSMTRVLERVTPPDFKSHVTPANGQTCPGQETPVKQAHLPYLVTDNGEEFVVWAQFGKNTGQWIRSGVESLSQTRAFRIVQDTFTRGLEGKGFCSELDSMGADFCLSECLMRPKSTSIIYVMPRRFIVPSYGDTFMLPVTPHKDNAKKLQWLMATWEVSVPAQRGSLVLQPPTALTWPHPMVGLHGDNIMSLAACEQGGFDCKRGMFSYTRRSLQPLCKMLDEPDPPAGMLSTWMLSVPSIIAPDAVRSLWSFPVAQREVAQQALSGKLMKDFRKLTASEHTFCQSFRRERFLSSKSGGELVPSDQVMLIGGLLDLLTLVPVISSACDSVYTGDADCSCERQQYFARMTKIDLQIYRLDLELAANDILRNGRGVRLHAETKGTVVRRVELRAARFMPEVTRLEFLNGFDLYTCGQIVVMDDVLSNKLYGCPSRPVWVTAHGLSAPVPGLVTMFDLGIDFTLDFSRAVVLNGVIMGLSAFGVSVVTNNVGEFSGKILLVTALSLSGVLTIGPDAMCTLLRTLLTTFRLPTHPAMLVLLGVGLTCLLLRSLWRASTVLVRNEFLTFGLLGLIYIARALDDVLLAAMLFTVIGLAWPLNRKLIAATVMPGDSPVSNFIATEKVLFLVILIAIVSIGYDTGRVYTCLVGLLVLSNNTLVKLFVIAFVGEALFADFDIPVEMMFIGYAFSYLTTMLDVGARILAVPKEIPSEEAGKGPVRLSLESRARLAFDLQTDLAAMPFGAAVIQLCVHLDLFLFALFGMFATADTDSPQVRRAAERYAAEIKKCHESLSRPIDVNYLKALVRATGVSEAQAKLQTSTLYYTQQLSTKLQTAFEQALLKADVVASRDIEPIATMLSCASEAIIGPPSQLTAEGPQPTGLGEIKRLMTKDETVQPATHKYGKCKVTLYGDIRSPSAVVVLGHTVEPTRTFFVPGDAGTIWTPSGVFDFKVDKRQEQPTGRDSCYPPPFNCSDRESLLVFTKQGTDEQAQAAIPAIPPNENLKYGRVVFVKKGKVHCLEASYNFFPCPVACTFAVTTDHPLGVSFGDSGQVAVLLVCSGTRVPVFLSSEGIGATGGRLLWIGACGQVRSHGKIARRDSEPPFNFARLVDGFLPASTLQLLDLGAHRMANDKPSTLRSSIEATLQLTLDGSFRQQAGSSLTHSSWRAPLTSSGSAGKGVGRARLDSDSATGPDVEVPLNARRGRWRREPRCLDAENVVSDPSRSGSAVSCERSSEGIGVDEPERDLVFPSGIAIPKNAPRGRWRRRQDDYDPPRGPLRSTTTAGLIVYVLDVEYIDSQPVVEYIAWVTDADVSTVNWAYNEMQDFDSYRGTFPKSIRYVCQSSQEATWLVRAGITMMDTIQDELVCTHYPVSFDPCAFASKTVLVGKEAVGIRYDTAEEALTESDGSEILAPIYREQKDSTRPPPVKSDPDTDLGDPGPVVQSSAEAHTDTVVPPIQLGAERCQPSFRTAILDRLRQSEDKALPLTVLGCDEELQRLRKGRGTLSKVLRRLSDILELVEVGSPPERVARLLPESVVTDEAMAGGSRGMKGDQDTVRDHDQFVSQDADNPGQPPSSCSIDISKFVLLGSGGSSSFVGVTKTPHACFLTGSTSENEPRMTKSEGQDTLHARLEDLRLLITDLLLREVAPYNKSESVHLETPWTALSVLGSHPAVRKSRVGCGNLRKALERMADSFEVTPDGLMVRLRPEAFKVAHLAWTKGNSVVAGPPLTETLRRRAMPMPSFAELWPT